MSHRSPVRIIERCYAYLLGRTVRERDPLLIVVPSQSQDEPGRSGNSSVILECISFCPDRPPTFEAFIVTVTFEVALECSWLRIRRGLDHLRECEYTAGQ